MTRYFAGVVPKFIVRRYGSARAFKALKRKHFRAALEAINDLRMGCAFFPCGGGAVDKAASALDEIQRAICVKEWGR